jgi:hypothetical protein
VDTWHRPLQKTWGYVLYPIAGLLGVVTVVAVVGFAATANWSTAAVNAVIEIPVLVVLWRLAGAGVYVNGTGVRVSRLFTTSTHPWSQVDAFEVRHGELRILLSSGVNIGTGVHNGETGGLMLRYLNARHFAQLVRLLNDAKAASRPATAPHWLEPYLPALAEATYQPLPAGARPTRQQTRAMALAVVLPIAVTVIAAGTLIATLSGHAHHTDTAPAKPAAATAFTADYFTLPASAGGLPATKNPSLIDDVRSFEFAADQGYGGYPAVIGAFQSPHDPDDAFLLIGKPVRIDDPAEAVARTLANLLRSADVAIESPVPYDLDSRGGVMRCADATESLEIVPRASSICVLADAGGLIVGVYELHSGSADAAITTAVRADFEK